MNLRIPVLSVCLLTACISTTKPLPPKPAATTVPSAAALPVAPQGNLEVLMLNGGGSPWLNSQSHLLHLQHLRDLLARAKIPADRISILASDGTNPEPDLAVRETQPEADFWRLEGTHVEPRLQTPTTLIDSKLPGATLELATKQHLTEWFAAAAKRLAPNDTLLLYVTDHGTRPTTDNLDNRILLWGKEEHITVRELSALIAGLDPKVRVVSLMSQCFSGGFAELSNARLQDGEPTGNVCGYFSSTADRKAYGCFTENMGKDNVGHSFEFFRALEQANGFEQAHQTVLITDATPDVPLRSSDVYLQSLLVKDATAHKLSLDAHADALLKEAFVDSGKWQQESRLLDRIAQAYGGFSPRSLAELTDLTVRLPKIEEQLTTVSHAWSEALADSNESILVRFMAERPDWAARLAQPALLQLVPAQERRLTAELLPQLAQFTAKDPALAARSEALHARGTAADDATYRMQVRLAVVLRLRTVLLTIAGRKYLQLRGTPQQKAAFEALTACEGFSLPNPQPPAARPAAVKRPIPPGYPQFDEDVKLTQSALPGWIGISFKEPEAEEVKKHQLPPGASLVQVVYPNSPAQQAGFAVGDIVLGPPGAEFTSKNQIRAWTMLAEVNKPAPLTILRDGKRRQISIAPGPFPMKWPTMPGPVQIGAAAPAVQLKAYKGAALAQVKKPSPHLLYFWATWCGPCKAAMPELLAFEKERKIPVVAVTDEPSKVLDKFFKKFSSPFTKSIATDERRRTFVAYGVSGTPTFVLVDEKGNVVWHQVGYRPAQGLTIPGWTWSGRKQ